MSVFMRLAICVVFIVAGALGAARASDSNDHLVVGVTFDIPGMGYQNPETGAVEGFEPSIARAIGEYLFGSPDSVEFVQVLDDQRIQALQDGVVDVVISQLTITPDRAEQVDFSVPYYVTGEGLLVPAGSDIKSFQDLAGKRIAATAGSLSLRRMTASLPSLPGASVIAPPLSLGTVQAVENGEADAASNDLIDLMFLRMASEDPNQFVLIDIGDEFEPKPFGAAVKKGNQALVDQLNEAIESLQSNGDIDRLLNEAIASMGQ